MKKIWCLSIGMLVISLVSLGISTLNVVQAKDRNFEDPRGPVGILETVKQNANAYKSEEVQKTQLDNTTSKYCTDIGVDDRFTFTRTLCYIKNNVGSYLQYVMFIGLAAATILLIWNGFKLVTSSDRGKQMTTFKKNLIYIIIGITLLLGFYYFLDIYVGIINLFSD